MTYSLDDIKQYCKLIAEETNVKELGFLIGQTERGVLSLRYSLADNDFFYAMNDERWMTKPSAQVINDVVNKSISK